MSLAPIPIYQDQDFYVPQFEIKVGERPLNRDVVHDITAVTYKDDLRDVDSFEITINNWDADTRRFKYSDDHLFDPGKKLEVWMGYRGRDQLRLMLTGEITSLRPTFPSDGRPTLAISGLNLLHHFRREQRSHAYRKQTDSRIAREIAARVGADIHTDPEAERREEEHRFLFQDNQFDILFLMERARHLGYDLFVEEVGENGRADKSRLYFGPSQNVHRTTYRLEYGKSLAEFQPNLTTANQVGEVTVHAWDPIAKRPITATAKRNQTGIRDVGAADGQGGIGQAFNERHEVIADETVDTQREAETLAEQTLARIAKDIIKASGSTVGLPDLRAGSVMHIDGLGSRFRGAYFITSTTHTIGDGGYTTRFDCRREEPESGRRP